MEEFASVANSPIMAAFGEVVVWSISKDNPPSTGFVKKSPESVDKDALMQHTGVELEDYARHYQMQASKLYSVKM